MFLETLGEKVKILSTTWHDAPIGLTTPISNKFILRLRATKHLSQKEKVHTEHILGELFSKGFPNYFGSQRFGVEGKNRKKGQEILRGTLRLKDTFEIGFKLQAYASYLFNRYVDLRTRKGLRLQEADLLSLPT